IHLIRGHVLFKIHKHLIGPTKYLTFIRHPASRVVSLYHFMKSTPQNRLYPVIHKNNMSLKDFVLHIDDADINNTQIKRIGGGPFLTENEQLEKALKNIEEYFPVVGIVEQYDESLMLLKNYYQWSWPFYATVNKNKQKPKSEVPEDVREIILQKNQGDLQLYNEMKSQLDNQIKKSEQDIAQQVKKFQSLNKYFIHHYLITAYSKLT
ncbi:MAG: sulfotransferase family 2 domain-containing protein, partial [Bacteroidia bacterium]|nr:sulfotransferase family 2 domain-containing protein [Bacteroidia bacterium]